VANPLPPKDPRDSGRWRKLRAELRRHAMFCALCFVPLDHSNPRSRRAPQVDHIVPLDHSNPRSRRAPQVDHIVPLHIRPDLAFERSNLRVVCLSCNASTGASSGKPGTAQTGPHQPAAAPAAATVRWRPRRRPRAGMVTDAADFLTAGSSTLAVEKTSLPITFR
jgi:5-methylcytosine-specific restriction endonuclease McrA